MLIYNCGVSRGQFLHTGDLIFLITRLFDFLSSRILLKEVKLREILVIFWYFSKIFQFLMLLNMNLPDSLSLTKYWSNNVAPFVDGLIRTKLILVVWSAAKACCCCPVTWSQHAKKPNCNVIVLDLVVPAIACCLLISGAQFLRLFFVQAPWKVQLFQRCFLRFPKNPMAKISSLPVP